MLLEGKKILIMGIRNKWSIAFGIAKSAYENGAQLLFTYMGEENKEKIEELVSEFKGSKAYVLNGASEDEKVRELSYLTFNRYQSEMLFQIISERSERASVIISTNLEFSQWTQLFENEMLLAALIDRVTFRSFVLNMNCSSSYRIDSTLNHD